MNTLQISECLAEEEFLASLILGVSVVALEDDLGGSAITRDACGQKIASVMMEVDRHQDIGGEIIVELLQVGEQVSESPSEVDRSGAVIRTTAGSLHEGGYAGVDLIPTLPPSEIISSHFDPFIVGERIVPEAALASFAKWNEKDVVDDLIGEELPLDFVNSVKCEELSEMYRRSVWAEVPVQDCMDP